jgi:hypothetical protein
MTRISAYERKAVEKRIDRLKNHLYALGTEPIEPVVRARRLRGLLFEIRALQAKST